MGGDATQDKPIDLATSRARRLWNLPAPEGDDAMENQIKPYVWQMVREAVEALGGETTNVAVRSWIQDRYPGTNRNTIGCQIIICTVNHDSRVHYTENLKPRLANGKYDFLFRPERGKLIFYDPDVHGQWEIAEVEDGKLVVRLVGLDNSPESQGEGECFAAEAHLRDFLVKHLDTVEPGLQLYSDDEGKDGVEYQTGVGRIDILAVDAQGSMVVIELKVSKGPDSVVGQLMRYKGWLKRHRAEGASVRGIIVASHISDRIRYAVADLPEISLKQYDLKIELRDVPHVDDIAATDAHK